MIDIKKKEDCVGCNACVQRCPKQCISMKEDEQGFLYPKVDLDKCIDCHLCEKDCPVINQAEPRKPLHTYAAKNKKLEEQRTSSSGGVFFALVEYIITEKHGVVFGARFNDKWEVVHDYAENIEDAKAFKGSKYVQSRIGENYKKAEDFLKAGRTVLFSGTPCQIAGLRLFLRKEYGDQLLLVDTACHGVPSPLIWMEYLTKVSSENGSSVKNISDISFRDKRNGWQNYGMRIQFFNGEFSRELYMEMQSNLYMQGFLKDIYLRPSCYACPAKCGKSCSDITLADFWGIQKTYPELYQKGLYSLILIKSEKVENALKSSYVIKEETSFFNAISGNPAIEHSAKKPKQYTTFWTRFQTEGINAIIKTLAEMRLSIIKRTFFFVRRIAGASLRKIGLKK